MTPNLYPTCPISSNLSHFESAWIPGEVGIFTSGHTVTVCDGANHWAIYESGRREWCHTCPQGARLFGPHHLGTTPPHLRQDFLIYLRWVESVSPQTQELDP